VENANLDFTIKVPTAATATTGSQGEGHRAGSGTNGDTPG
jgi:hypothetical protein